MTVVISLGVALSADTGVCKVPVRFAKGASNATINGTIQGDASTDYLVRASAGQKLTVTLKAANASNYFNVLPPGSDNVAMYNSSSGDQTYSVVLPDDGDYAIRVYLMRSAARRKEASKFTLTVGVEGKALTPVPASKDALVRGTRFHAAAPVKCSTGGETKECKGFVVRRQPAGAATVEIQGANGFKRRILFDKGAPVSSDAMDQFTVDRKNDVMRVKFESVEWYEIVDAMITGG
jgi:hypothetical protein